MSRTGQTGPGAAAARLLALLAVVLGLVAMHGLASAHHAAAAPPGHATAAPARHAPSAVAKTPLLPQDRARTHRHDRAASGARAATATAAALPAEAVAPAVPAGGDGCPSGLAVLCAAVIAAAAAMAWLVAAAAARRRVPASPPAAARRPVPPPLHGDSSPARTRSRSCASAGRRPAARRRTAPHGCPHVPPRPTSQGAPL